MPSGRNEPFFLGGGRGGNDTAIVTDIKMIVESEGRFNGFQAGLYFVM